MRRWVEAVVRYRKAVIAALLAATAFFAWHVPSMKVNNNIDLWAPQENSFVKTTKQIEKLFGNRNTVIIGVVPESGTVYQPYVLSAIRQIQDAVSQMPQAVRRDVISLAAPRIKAIMGTRDGMEVRPMLAEVPTSEPGLDRLKAMIVENPVYINALVSSDERAAAVIASFRVEEDDPSYDALYQRIEDAVGSIHDPRIKLYLGGAPVGYAWVEKYTAQSPFYFGFAFLIILAVQYWAFRSWQGMLLPTLTACLSVVWGLGIIGLLGLKMDVLNTTTPILLMAMASGHAIQILKRYYEEYAARTGDGRGAGVGVDTSKAAVIESLASVGPVMLIAGIIAAISFFSLTHARIALVRHFGLLASAGIASAVLIELTFIPAVRSLLPAPRQPETARVAEPGALERWLGRLAERLVGGQAVWIFAGGIAVMAVIGAGAFRLHADSRLMGYFSQDSSVRASDTRLNAMLGGTNSMFFLVHGDKIDSLKDPQVLNAMASLQRFLDKEPYVGKTQSLADIISRMNMAMHGNEKQYDSIPERQDLISQYLLLYSMSAPPQDFSELVDENYQNAVVRVYLKTDSTAYAATLYQKAQTFIAQTFPKNIVVDAGGSVPETMAINTVVVQEKLQNLLQMMAVVFLLSSLAMRSLAAGLFVVTPLALIILANFGLMGWLGIPLDMGTATVASMAIGIGADYEIYLLFRFREELRRTGDIAAATRNSLMTSGKAIVFVALAVAGGYSVLLMSDFAFYQRLAALVMATMVVSAVAALVFLRSMMMLFKPRFIFGDYHARPSATVCIQADD